MSRLSGTLTDGIILVTPTVDDVGDAGPIVAVDPHAGAVDHAQRPLRQPRRRDHGDRVPHRPRPPPHRLPRRSPRPRVGAAARAGLPRRAGRRRHRRSIPTSSASASTSSRRPRSRPASCSTLADPPTAIFAANDLSAIQTMNVARSLGLSVPGRRVGDRVRQHPGVGAHRAAADDDRPVDPDDGRGSRAAARRPARRAPPTARSRSPCRPSSSSASRAERIAPMSTRSTAPARRRRRRLPRPGAADRRAGRRPARPDDARGEGRPARQRLGVPARRRPRRSTTERAADLLRHGLGQVTRISGASSLGAARRRRRWPTPSSATSSPRPASASRRSSTRRSAPG